MAALGELPSMDYTQWLRQPGVDSLAEMSRFFMKEGSVFDSLHRITRRLDELGIPYAVAGGLALNAHGYQRATTDVDILVDAEGLKAVHLALDGLGYVPPFTGSKHLRDASTNVRIEFLVSGQFPGDGKPKPVAFPNPRDVGVEIDGVRYIALPSMFELKLASGMTNAGRLKDIADAQELIRNLSLPRDFSLKLNPFVRTKYEELWDGLAADSHAKE